MTVYEGGCHCGQVRFRLTKPQDVTEAIACNCSLCSKKGILIVAAEETELEVTQGEESLTRYQFGSKTASHWFCNGCGIHVMTRPRMNPHRFGVNARCFDGFHAMQAGLTIVPFDGQNHPKDRVLS